MILSVCPNPSIDLTVELDQLNIGRLNRIANKVVTYSGKALNAAIGVSRLGGDSYATGFMFENDSTLFAQRLEKEGVKSQFVQNKGGVRINYKIIDKRSMLTEINDIGEEVSIDKQEELLRLVAELSKKASVVILSGSLPKGIDNLYYSRLLNVIPKDVKKIVDCDGEKLTLAIKTGNVFMAKPNLSELENIVKTSLTNNKEYVEGCMALIRMGAEYVLLSLGKDGAILTNGTRSLYCKSTTVAVNSTVGAGDSMVAAASVMLDKGLPMEEVLKCAVAAGTASITTPGTNLFYKDKYEEIYNKLYVEEI